SSPAIAPYPYPYPYYGSAGGPGVSTMGTDNVTRPAETASLTAVRGQYPDPAPINADERARIIEQLKGLGLTDADVTFPPAPYSQQDTAVAVRLPLDRMPQIANDVLDRITQTLGPIDHSFVRYGLTTCAATLADMRQRALAKARTQAESL